MDARTPGKVLCQSSSLVYGLALIGAVPVLMKSFEDTFDLSHKELGLAIGLGALAGVIGACVGGLLYDRHGGRTVVIWAMALSALIALNLFSVQTAVAFVVVLSLSYFAQGMGGMTDPLVNRLYGANGTRGLNLAHGCQGVGRLLAPLLVAACLWATGGWRACFIVAAGLYAMLGVSLLAIFKEGAVACVPATSDPPRVKQHKRMKLKSATLLGLSGFVFASGTETALVYWLPSFLESEAGFPKETALYAFAFLTGGFTGIRILLSVIKRLDPSKLIPASVLPYLVTFFLLVHVRHTWLLYAASFALGLCLGPFYPSLQAAIYKTNAPTMHGRLTSLIAVTGAGARCFFLSATGWIASAFSLKHALMFSPVCMVGFVAIYCAFSRMRGEQEPSCEEGVIPC